MSFDIEAIIFGGKCMLVTAFSSTVVVLLPHTTLSHLSNRPATQIEELFGDASLPNRSCLIERLKYVRLPEVHDGRSATDL